MWKVGSESTMRVGCNTKSNFPISIELDYYGGKAATQAHLDNTHGMWFDVADAKYLIDELQKAVARVEAAEHCIERDVLPATVSAVDSAE